MLSFQKLAAQITHNYIIFKLNAIYRLCFDKTHQFIHYLKFPNGINDLSSRYSCFFRFNTDLRFREKILFQHPISIFAIFLNFCCTRISDSFEFLSRNHRFAEWNSKRTVSPAYKVLDEFLSSNEWTELLFVKCWPEIKVLCKSDDSIPGWY